MRIRVRNPVGGRGRRDRRSRNRGFALARRVAVGVLAISGCAGSTVATRELGEDPIAFVYHSEDLARRRAEAMQDPSAAQTPSNSGENRGVLNLTSFGEFLGYAFGGKDSPRYRGQLAFLNPKTRELRIIEGPQRGAIPQDWSADRRRLLFAQGDPGYLQLFEYDRETREVGPKTHGPDPHPQGCYASDGRLVVTLHRSEVVPQWGPRPSLTSRLAILSATGAKEEITTGPVDGDPACSPDGRSIAYVRALAGGTQIWVQSLDPGAQGRVITPGRDPAYSPDGLWIVFSRDDRDPPTLWRIRADGVGRTRVGTGGGAEEFQPAVSPDGTLVVYESVLRNRYRLFMRRFDGTGDVVLFASGDGSHAVW